VEGVLEQVEKRFRFSYSPDWAAAYVSDPVHFIKAPGGWMLPFSMLASCEVQQADGKEYNLMQDAKESFVRLAGGEGVRDAVLKEIGQLRVSGVPPMHADVCEALSERKQLEDGRVVLQPAAQRRQFWLMHMYTQFPHLAAAAGRLLSAHVTSCATERNWSLFGNIFTKTKNRLALERAKKLAYIRTNGSQRTLGADEEIQLSVIDVLDEEEGGEEGETMEIA